TGPATPGSTPPPRASPGAESTTAAKAIAASAPGRWSLPRGPKGRTGSRCAGGWRWPRRTGAGRCRPSSSRGRRRGSGWGGAEGGGLVVGEGLTTESHSGVEALQGPAGEQAWRPVGGAGAEGAGWYLRLAARERRRAAAARLVFADLRAAVPDGERWSYEARL